MILGVQYYRPPFPEQRFWEDDSWEDVLPGKNYNRTYSEMADWALFFIWRQNHHLSYRYRILEEEDPNHIVSVHRPCSTMYHGGCYE